ncbi:hypothetical protein N1F89_07220 [Aquibium sp. A9E412]|uniref:trypsin-like serine peptidase n=1 Tax=Aquibium sp. A9E412 TaxID=2976767 RepID=UPI0025AFC6B1|nr:hypothetical protein [Aquibium sp. A9E412]MDN2566006.1 hypothetical protein [Aquibium sp. A9E412]
MSKRLIKTLGASALLAASAMAFVATGHAQMANQGQGLANDGDAAFASHGGDGVVSTAAPTGPGLSRLPLTTPDVMPYDAATVPAEAPSGASSSGDPEVGTEAYGTSTEGWPYSHQRVAVTGPYPGPGTYAFQVPVTSRPYRWAGKLWMRFDNSWFVCSAALIKKGVLVTAAHCVHQYGQGAGGFADEVRWYPANLNAAGGPWGYYQGVNWIIPTVYRDGTDTCQSGANGVVCNNDIATVTLAARNGLYPGQGLGGWYWYGWNGYSYKVNSSGFGNHTIAEINQLGYPVAWDSGRQMQRNNSFGKYVTSTSTTNGQLLKNTQLGSPLSGGSSGGPWIVNFSTRPLLTNTSDASYGAMPTRNVIVGTTSWGYTNKDINVQGASWFGQNNEFPNASYGSYGAGNIGALVQYTCTTYAAYC